MKVGEGWDNVLFRLGDDYAWAGEEPDALRMRARRWALALGLAYLAQSRDDAAIAALGQKTIDGTLNEREEPNTTCTTPLVVIVSMGDMPGGGDAGARISRVLSRCGEGSSSAQSGRAIWVSREQGWHWEYGDVTMQNRVERIVLHGSIDGPTPEEALAAVLSTCGLAFRLEGDRLIVSPAQHGKQVDE